MTREDELHIISRVLDGDTNAFSALVTEHQSLVYNLALRTLGNAHDAEDMAQEAFIRAYSSLDKFRGDSKFSVWLYRLTSNICIDFLRSKNRRPTSSLTAMGENNEAEEIPIIDEKSSPQTILETREMRESLNRGLDTLSYEYREILILREIEGLSYDEIAEKLKIEAGTVKSRIFRARKKLCEFLEQDGNIPEHLSSKSKREGVGK